MSIATSEKFFKRSWISAAVLKDPAIESLKLRKGAMILNQVDPIVEMYPNLKNLFYIIERHGWFGPNEATQADIMLIDDLSYFNMLKKRCRNSVLLKIGTADFVDERIFRPLPGSVIKYDVVQVSCWSERKRIEILLETASRMPDLTFLHLGHFENNGKKEELAYKRKCLMFAKDNAPNVFFAYAESFGNDTLPTSKTIINRYINSARIGVITTRSEGINRFKMECLAAGKPCLVPNDVAAPTRKHITDSTGILYAPNPDSLAEAIRESLSRLDSFNPRKYMLENTGKSNSLPKLKSSLNYLCRKSGHVFQFNDIDWDGRNESMAWGEDAIALIEEKLAQFQSLEKVLNSHPMFGENSVMAN